MEQLDGAVTPVQLSVVPVLVVPLAANPLGAAGLALHVAPLLQAPFEVQGSPEPVTPLLVEGLFPCVHQLAV
jgi:hypothetical protein